jgi:hypothetical protein
MNNHRLQGYQISKKSLGRQVEKVLGDRSQQKEFLNGRYGFKADTVGFYDCCFVVLVFTQYCLPTQGTQLCKLCLQLGGQVLCFLL